jgi:argininosuccinate lyase
MSDKLWGGRFSEDTDALVEKFNASIDVDKRLYASDIEGSMAHLKMMAKQQIIAQDEAEMLLAGLDRVKTRIENKEIAFSYSLEDIHMHVEDALGQECGDLAKNCTPAGAATTRWPWISGFFLKKRPGRSWTGSKDFKRPWWTWQGLIWM